MEDPKFKVSDYVRIWKYKNIFAKAMFQIGLKKFLWLKSYFPNRFEEVYLIKKVRNIVLWTYVISDLIVGTFYKRELQKINSKSFRVEKVILRKGDKLYVYWMERLP